jgi:hypothetical protein
LILRETLDLAANKQLLQISPEDILQQLKLA